MSNPKTDPSIHRASHKGLAGNAAVPRSEGYQRGKRHARAFSRLVTAGLMSSATSSGKTPARVTFSYLTPNNLGVVRKLNSVLFPIKYAEKYYKDILAPEVEDFCQLGERGPFNRAWKTRLCTSL